MFIHKIPENVEAMLAQLQCRYARAVIGIRACWGHHKDMTEFYSSLLHYYSDNSKEGFDFEAYRILQAIKDEHDKLELIEKPEPDTWDKIY
jgi:hypothetical protein